MSFAIRCPRCFEWSTWDQDPASVAIEEAALKRIIPDLAKFEYKNSKVLSCKQPLGVCPAPVQAVVVQDPNKAHALAQEIPSWSSPRVFRPFKRKNGTDVWDDYGVITFNCRPVARQPNIEFEMLLDRNLLAEAISGITERTNFPLTIFAAHVPPDREPYWLPIEGSSSRTDLVPPRFNSFCEICRRATALPVAEEFEAKKLPQECPVGLSDYCQQRFDKPPCELKEWSRCFAFAEELLRLNLCYESDVRNIRDIELTSGSQCHSTRCWAGLTEMSFPIVVHDHLAAVAMTGQFVIDPEVLATPTMLVHRNPKFKAFEKQLENVYAILQCNQPARYAGEAVAKAFLLKKPALDKVEIDLAKDVALIEKIANLRYKSFRNLLEASFRQELLWRAKPGALASPAVSEPMLKEILGRMVEFCISPSL